MFKNILTSLLIFVLLINPPAWAHSVALWAEYIGQNRVKAQAYTSSGHHIRKAKIIVYDTDKNKLFEGVSDIAGKLIFDSPKGYNELIIKLVVDNQHKSEFLLKKESLSQ